MTVPSETNRSGPYNGNGVTTAFDYEFRIVNEAYLKAIKADADGLETILTLATDYTVTGVGEDAGGQVILGVALPTGETLTLLPHVPFTQEIDLENQGAYYAETVEAGFDLAVMRDQQLQEQINRAVTIPASEDPAQLTGLVGDILRLADSADNIDTVAENISDVGTVADHIANVDTVAGISANVTTVAGIAANVTAVAANADDISTAADNIAAIIAAPDAAAAASTSETNAGNSASAAAGSASAAAASAASINLPAIVAGTFLFANALGTAYDPISADAARLEMTALKGYDIASFAGADESAKLAALIASAPTNPYVYRSDSHIGIIRDTAPLNYQGTRAALVLQRRDAAAGALNELIPGAMFQFAWSGDGEVTAGSDLSQTIHLGLVSSVAKIGDGSMHAVSAIGSLGAYGAGLYNELGGFQGELTNIGSLHGTMSGLEVLLKDSSDAGVNDFDTTMNAVIGRVARYNAGSRKSRNFFASSEGTVALDAILGVNTAGLHAWVDGVNLVGGTFSSGQAYIMPNNTAVASRNAAGNANLSLLFLDASDHTWIEAGGKSKNIFFANSDLEKQFSVLSTDDAVNYFEASGAAAGNAPLLWLQGAGADIGGNYATKGAGVHSFYTGGTSFYKQVEISHLANAANWVTLAGGIAGTPAFVKVSAGGASTDIDLLLSGKGAGTVTFPVAKIAATATAGTNGAPPAQVSGYITAKLSGNVAIRIPYYNA